MTAQKMKEFIDLHIKEQVSIEIGNAIINVSYQDPNPIPGCTMQQHTSYRWTWCSQ